MNQAIQCRNRVNGVVLARNEIEPLDQIVLFDQFAQFRNIIGMLAKQVAANGNETHVFHAVLLHNASGGFDEIGVIFHGTNWPTMPKMKVSSGTAKVSRRREGKLGRHCSGSKPL